MKFAEKNTRSQSNNATHSANGKNPPFFQPRLNFGKPGDAYEVEADKMADRIIEKSTVDKTTFFAPPVQSQVSKVPAAALSAVQNNTELLTSEEPDRLQLLADDEFEEVVQPKVDNRQIPSSGFETQLTGSKEIGSELPAGVKSEMETGFGADFSNVRIHTGNDAVQMSRQIGAQAFTHGNDIFFNEGKFDPSLKTGRHLLAHELTHTIQQGSSVQGKMVQKVDGNNDVQDESVSVNDIQPSSDGRMSETSQGIKMELENFRVKENINPSWDGPPYKLPRSGGRNTRQISIWRNDVRPLVVNRIEDMTSNVDTENNKYTLVLKNNSEISFVGTKAQIANEIFIPNWNNQGIPTTYQVEHLIDWQLAGGNKDVDIIDNLILLDAQTNNALGQTVLRFKNEHIARVLQHYQQAGITQNVSNAMNSFDIFINSVSPDIPVGGSIIKKADIESATGDNPFREQIIEIRNFEVPQGCFLLKTSQAGGSYIIPYNANGFQSGSFIITVEGNAETNSITSIILDPIVDPENVNKRESSSYEVEAIGTNEFRVQGLKNRLRNFFELKLLSPVELNEDQLEIMAGMNIYAIGKVMPSVPILSEADIDIVIEGKEIRLRKLFNIGEIDIPAPFEIAESSLEIYIGTQGLGINGLVNFGINQVGQGHIGASASTSGGFALEGAFNFDSDLFDPAQINVEYRDNIWTIGGTIGIPEGKIRGVKGAQITASYSENNFTASGEAELDIPGIERGLMEVRYGEEGFSIAGNFDLSSDIPGIRSGNVEARISKENSSEGYNVFVSGTANPDIPGINSTLAVTYDNGALTLEGSADYRRGMLSGRIDVGATNRAIGDDGQPTGEPDRTMRVYGGGSLTLQLTPWLAATAGVRFLPNGEMVVTARLSTDTYTVFARREYNRNLFRVPTIEIPIIAIPLGPRSIGLVAQIGGGLDFNAGFGPGQLRNLSAEISYNPDREDETTVRGHGEFVIPANAALVLRGDLSLGVSIAIASLTGGIELAGSLGLEGEAAAQVDVNWSPAEGLALDAQGSVLVNPKFAFDINAFARASLGIGWFSISETWRYNIVSFQWGPNIRFGIIFPIHYREGEPFDMSFDDIELIYPELDVVEMSVGLARSIKDRIFD